MLYMVTFTINIPPMLAYIPYMDPMGYIYIYTNQYIYIYTLINIYIYIHTYIFIGSSIILTHTQTMMLIEASWDGDRIQRPYSFQMG